MESIVLEHTMYHRVLRVALVVAALLLVFESGIASHSTVRLSMDTHHYLAQVIGVGAAVEPTELNTMTAELTKQKKQLDDRDAALKQREIQVNLRENSDPNQTAIYVLSVLVFILLLLIITNYILDYLRATSTNEKSVPKTV